ALAQDQGDYPARALTLSEEALKGAPDLWELHVARARVLGAAGRRREARAELDRVPLLAPGEQRPMLEKPEVLLALGETELALRDAERAAALGPQAVLEALVLRAEVKEALLDEKGARVDAEQVRARAAAQARSWGAAARAHRVLARAALMTGD